MTDLDRSVDTPRRQILRLAARQWPHDDLARLGRKTSAVMRHAGVNPDDDHLDVVGPFGASIVADCERIFARIEAGDLRAHMRVDGSFELRPVVDTSTLRPKRKRTRR